METQCKQNLQPSQPPDDHGVTDSVRFQLGYERGYQAAREAIEWAEPERELMKSPPSVQDLRIGSVGNTMPQHSQFRRELSPPPPPSIESRLERVNTTPQGTPVPPPRPQPPQDRSSLDTHLSFDFRGNQGRKLAGLFDGSPVVPSQVRASELGVGFRTSTPAQDYADPRVGLNAHDRSYGGVGSGEVGLSQGSTGNQDPWTGLDIGSMGIKQGRDGFTPGDRTYWELPRLEDPSLPAAATRASDWLTQIRPLLFDLSDMSQLWWGRVEWEAQQLYQRWSKASALEKGLIAATVSPELIDARFRRLESRAYSMLQASVPQVIRDELIASRSLTCVGLLYQVLKVYAPGGLQERSQVLTELTHLGVAKSASEAVQMLRSWQRSHARAVAMNVMVPDPALILKGVDSMGEGLLKKASNAQVSFRISTARNLLQLDHHPTMVSVVEFMKVLQSEWEQVAVSGADEAKPKVAKMDTEPGTGPKGTGNDKGKSKGGSQGSTQGNPPNPPSNPSPESGKGGGKSQDAAADGKGKGSKGSCKFYLSPKGCMKGRECGSYHEFSTAKGESRCYNCGSTMHKQSDCTRPGGKGKGKPLGEYQGSSGHASSNSLGSSGNQARKEGTGSGLGSTGTSGSQSEGKHGGKGSGIQNANPKDSTTVAAPSGNRPTVAAAQAEVLEEAQRLLKSLRLAALKVPSGTPRAEISDRREVGASSACLASEVSATASESLKRVREKKMQSRFPVQP